MGGFVAEHGVFVCLLVCVCELERGLGVVSWGMCMVGTCFVEVKMSL